MIKVAYNNLIQSIEKRYYQHGLYCSSNAYRFITCTCIIILIMSIGILYSPLVHGNAVVEWRSGKPDNSDSRSPQWLHSPPLASVQHIMLQLQHTSPFEAMKTMFVIQEDIIKTQIENTENGVLLKIADVCFKVPDGLTVKGLPEKGSCFFLTPTLLWQNQIVEFLSDPDITETLLKDREIAGSSQPHLRALLFGPSWTTSPHPIIITLFLNPNLPTTLITQFREAIISQLTPKYSVSILTEKDFKSDYIVLKNEEKSDIFPELENERVHLFYSDKVNVMELLPLIMLYILVFIYIVISVRKITLVKSKVGLACVAVATIVFSFVMSLGFCVFFDLLPTITGSDIFPYIFTLVGLENVLTITRSVTITAGDQDVHIRVAQGLSTEGTRITKNVCGLAVLFISGLLSPVPPAFHEFCMVGLVCVICDFFLQLFFFVPVLSLDIRRLDLSDLKSGTAQSVPVNGKIPDWTDRPRKTRIFRYRATHKVLMLSVFLYVCYVVYHSIWYTHPEKSGKKLTLPLMLSRGSTRIIQWILSSDILQNKNNNKKSSYEEIFPHTFYTIDNTVDMLDQSWRRVARDSWPYLFKHYSIPVTARYFDVYKPIYVEEKSTIDTLHSSRVTFQSQVKQWLQMPVTLHLVSTLVGLVSFLPVALLLYICLTTVTRLLFTTSSVNRVKQRGYPLVEMCYAFFEHNEDIELVVMHADMILSTSVDGETILWNLKSRAIKLRITSEMVPWYTALVADKIALGHGDGSVNIINPQNNNVFTIHTHKCGVTYLTFIDCRTILLCYEDGAVETLQLAPDEPPATQDLETSSEPSTSNIADPPCVEKLGETRTYPNSLMDICKESGVLVTCGGSNIIKVYDAKTLTVQRVLQMPRSVRTLSLDRDMLYVADSVSSLFMVDISTGEINEESLSYRCCLVIDKITVGEDLIVALCPNSLNSNTLVWDKTSLSQPSFGPSAVEMSMIHDKFLCVKEHDGDISIWSLEHNEYLQRNICGTYKSTGPHHSRNFKLKSLSEEVTVLLNKRDILPITLLNC